MISDSDPDTEYDSRNNFKFITLDEELNMYNKLIHIKIYKNNNYIGYIKGVILCTDKLENLSKEQIKEYISYKDKEAEEEVQSFYEELSNRDLDNDNRLFYITEFYIENQFRKNGYGSLILNSLPNYLLETVSSNIEGIYLMPGPLEKVNGKVEYIYNSNNRKSISLKEKLIKFYEANGFKRIGVLNFWYYAL